MDWDKAPKWAEMANNGKDKDFAEPRWKWDCGLKLDFDGGLLRVSSRFYQSDYDIFDGSVEFLIGDDTVFRREFSSRHINVLREEVERYCRAVRENIFKLCRDNLSTFVDIDGK